MSGIRTYDLPCGKIYVNESNINQAFYEKGKLIKLAPKQVSFSGASQIDLVHYLISPGFWEAKHQFDSLLKKEGHVDILLDIHDVDRYGDNLMYTILPKGYVQFHPKNVSVDMWINEKAMPVWLGHPWVRQIFTGKKPEDLTYSITLDLNRIELKFESEKRCDDILLERAGVKMVNRTPIYMVTPSERKWAQNFFMGVDKPILGVVSHSSARIRTWPHMDELVQGYLNHGWFIIRLDDSTDGKYRFTFREMAALMEKCNLVVANDSAGLHLAGALRKRVVGIFGHTDGNVFAQNYEKAIIVNSMSCKQAPCWWQVPCLGSGSYHIKEDKEVQCLKDLSVAQVLKETDAGLKKVKKLLAVITTFNMLDWTKMAIDSLRTFHDLDLLVVDNDSTDGTHEWLTANGVKWMSKRQPVAAAWNMGLEEFYKGDYDYFLVFNNDIALRYDTIDGLVDLMEKNPEYGGITAQDMPIISPWLIDTTIPPSPLITNLVDIPTSAYSCTIFNRQCMVDTGRFDEWFTPRYIEDNDYTLRLRLKGWKLGKTTNPIYFHLVGGVLSSDEKEKRDRDIHWVKNIAYFREKWGIEPHAPQLLSSLGDETRKGQFVKCIDEVLKRKPTVSVLVHQKLGGWGDALFTTIVAKILRRTYGKKITIHYDVMDKYEDFYGRYPYIDSINSKKRADCSLNLDDTEFRVEWQEIAETGGIRSSRAKLYLNIAGLPEDDFKPDIFIREDEKVWANQEWGKSPRRVLVVPEGSNSLKHWHGMPQVAEALTKLGCNVMTSTTKYNFAQICALISVADLVISPDTGTSNVAGSCDVPVITIFSNRNKEPFERIYPTMIGVQGKCPYNPKNFCDYKMYCSKIEGPYRTKEQGFVEPECLKALNKDVVLAIAKEILG